MRVAALAFGVLAGLVASLILALGGLDVSADLGASADRQAQAIRFGLFIIGNLGIFGAALTLAAPLAGGIFLLAGAAAWVGAALLMHHSTDLVLITPPALLAVAAVFAIIAHVRRPRRSRDADGTEDDDVEVIPPLRARRDEEDDEEEDVGIPAFAAAEQKGQPSVRNAFNDDPIGADEWNPRKKQAPPPRTKPSFRPVEEEYDEDDEPSGFSRFAMGLSGLLSFGLYAALAGAAVLIFWNMRNDPEPPAVSVAEAPAISSSATLPPASSSEPATSSEQSLQPILTGESIRQVDPAGTAPSTTPSELVAETATSQEASGFGSVTMSDTGVPTLADDFSNDGEATPLGDISANPPSLPSEESSTAASSEALTPVELETAEAPAAPTTPTAASGGQLMPRTVPASMAALRTAPGTGPTSVVVRQPSNTNNTGL